METLVDAIEALDSSGEESAAIIGGIMTEILVRERALAMPRNTRDVDLGLPKSALRDGTLVEQIIARGYVITKGHILERASKTTPGRLAIDLLVPSYVTKQSKTVKLGPSPPSVSECLQRR